MESVVEGIHPWNVDGLPVVVLGHVNLRSNKAAVHFFINNVPDVLGWERLRVSNIGIKGIWIRS